MRIFISYSHDDQLAFDGVRAALEALKLRPWSDQNLVAGSGFTEQIQKYISHSHVFVAIITPNSHKRGWVHQEIGYAVAMHVPVIPICIGQLPKGMIEMAHAVVIKSDAVIKPARTRVPEGKSAVQVAADWEGFRQECRERLSRHNFQDLVENAGKRWLPAGECAHEPGARADLIERYSDEARAALGGPQVVRNAGGLSSFRIPNEALDHRSWRAQYADKPRSPEIYAKLLSERQALAKHADICGCKLIVNYGIDLDATYGVGAWRSRMRSLIEYLETLDDDRVEIALVSNAEPRALLAVGNWYLAESVAVKPIRGVQHTLFSSHAPTIDRRIVEFDRDLASYIKSQGSPPGKSRSWAIEVLRSRMDQLPAHPAWP